MNKFIRVAVLVLFIIGILLVAIVLLISFRHYEWSKKNIFESQNRGDRIVLALEKYYLENEAYPVSLEELIPKYLNKIEVPVVGNGLWDYRVHKNKNSFYLGFGDDPDIDPVSYITSKGLEWYLDTR